MNIGRAVGLAVVGLGRIAPSHLKAIARNPGFAKIVAVADADPARATQVAHEYDARHRCSSLDEVLALDEVEGVLLCTPNALHACQVEQVLAAGRHVLVEKPFAETVAQAERISALAEKTGLVLAAGHTFRHVEAVRQLQDRRASLGKLRAVDVSMCVFWDGPQAPWWAELTQEEGLILTLFAPHAIDFVQLVVGDVDPVRFHVEAARHQPGWQAEDEAMILLRYPDDVLASIHVSYNEKKVINRKVAHFENGTARVENGDELWIDDVPVVMPERKPATGEGHFNDGITHYFETQVREFALAVRGLPHRSVLPASALRQTRLNRAIIAAARRES